MRVSIIFHCCRGGIARVRAIAEFLQQSGSDPVADAARKAREDKKNAAKPKKVYTEMMSAATATAATTAVRLPQAMPVELPRRRCGPAETDDGGAKEDPNSEKPGGNGSRNSATS